MPASASSGAQQHGRTQNSATNATSESNDGIITRTLVLTRQLADHAIRLPTLILRLRDTMLEKITKMSQKEQDEYLEKHMAEFRGLLQLNFGNFQALVLSACPSPDQVDQPGYNEHRAIYCDLLQASTLIISRMRETIDQSMADYRQFIDDAWKAICAGQDPAPILKSFQQHLDKMTKESWDPLFAMADEMKTHIERVERSAAEKSEGVDCTAIRTETLEKTNCS